MISGASANVLDYGADSTGVLDSSSAFTAALDAVIAAGGGSIWIPYGTYKVNLDWSSQVIAQDYSGITIYGNNSLLLGVTGATALLTIDRGGTGDNWLGSRLAFNDLEFRTESNVCSGGTPVIPFAVKFIRSSANFYGCTFSGGSRASFYGVNYQYGKFIDCNFQCASVTPTIYPSAGCWIQSSYSSTVADQMTFDRCVFQSNQNGLYIQGCQQLRVLNSRVQGMFSDGTAGITVLNYTDGGGSEDILISSVHFEVNAVRDVYMPNQTSRTLIQQCVFSNPIGYVPTFVATVEQISTCMTYIANDFRTASGPTLTMSGDNAILTYIGNDKDPYSLITSGSNPRAIIQNATGAIDFQYSQLTPSGYWGSPGLRFATPVTGGTYLWVSATGVLRIKSGSAPTSDGDGVAVGSQT